MVICLEKVILCFVISDNNDKLILIKFRIYFNELFSSLFLCVLKWNILVVVLLMLWNVYMLLILIDIWDICFVCDVIDWLDFDEFMIDF